MRRTRKPTALVVAVGLACILGASPADAATKRFVDASGDVRVAQVEEDGTSGTTRPGGEVAPDIRSLTVRHARRTVAVTVRLAGLERPVDDQVLQVGVDFRGSNGQRRTVAITELDDKTASQMYRASNLRQVCARTLRTKVRYSDSAAQVRAVFPRRCIGSPRLLRVGAVVAVGDAAALFAAGSGELAYDYALRDGGEPTARPIFSPGVRHD